MRFLTILAITVALSGATLFTTGCGGGQEQKGKLTPEQYEAVWNDLLTNMKKKKYAKKDTDEVLKKHNLTEEEWKTENSKFNGMPAKIKGEYDKAMGGSKIMNSSVKPIAPQ